jgi:hypothetical protein
MSDVGAHGTDSRDCVAEGLRLILTHMDLKMMKKPVTTKDPAEQVVKDIRRAHRCPAIDT